MEKENRFITNTFSELEDVNRSPIFGYEDSPVLTLEEAVKKIVPPISHIMDYVAIAKKKSNQNSSLLTQDESAAIYLYSMDTSFYSYLNKTLRDKNRHALKPWFAFLKLFITALEKLPSTKATVWRGVNYDDTLKFVDDDVYIWWSVNSCSMALNTVQPFLGEKGTLFAIDAIHGKDISAFSAMSDENEVILMPKTYVRRRCESLNFNESLFIIHLEQIIPQR
jgi:hypothetical protein